MWQLAATGLPYQYMGEQHLFHSLAPILGFPRPIIFFSGSPRPHQVAPFISDPPFGLHQCSVRSQH